MSEDRLCERVSAGLAAYREGWLPERERAEVERHLAVCDACAAEARRDDRLRRLLAVLPPETPPAVTWAQVRTAHAAPRRPARRPVLALATASAGLALLLLVFRPGGTPPAPLVVPPSPTPAAVTSSVDRTLFADAHMALSAGSPAADPNRAVLMLYAATPGAVP